MNTPKTSFLWYSAFRIEKTGRESAVWCLLQSQTSRHHPAGKALLFHVGGNTHPRQHEAGTPACGQHVWDKWEAQRGYFYQQARNVPDWTWLPSTIVLVGANGELPHRRLHTEDMIRQPGAPGYPLIVAGFKHLCGEYMTATVFACGSPVNSGTNSCPRDLRKLQQRTIFRENQLM
jgi:hypothetical protein